nr:uncharacterized protein LOC113689267 [Coffea arabica]
MAKFWWGKKEDEKKIHWIKWSRMTDIKVEGGLGFRDLQDFNLALLGKQLWRILMQPNLLMSRVMKARYFGGKSIWDVQPKGSDSWCWKSLLSAREMLEEGLRRTEFEEKDRLQILKIPLSLGKVLDRIYWAKSSFGVYFVKTGYKLIKEMKSRQYQHRGASEPSNSRTIKSQNWIFLWGLSMPNKLKHFIWKCFQGILPTNTVVKGESGKGDHMCKCCGDGSETLEHMFFLCCNARAIWKVAPLRGGAKHDNLVAGEQEKGRRWDTPQAGWIKLNTDAALDQKLNKAGWGIAARNSSGELVGAWTRPTEGCAEAQVEEALAI